MEDSKIVELIYSRNETGINETAAKYGKLLYSVSSGILPDRLDCEECVNDTYVSIWGAIPPEKPTHYKAFICKIVRRLSLDR